MCSNFGGFRWGPPLAIFLYKFEIALSFQHHQANMIASLMITLGATPLFNITAGNAPIAPFGFFCVGTELRLMDCTLKSYELGDCDHSDVVGVRCLAASSGPGVCLYLWECQAFLV